MLNQWMRVYGHTAIVIACAALFACAHKNGKEASNPLDRVTTISIDPLVVMPDSIHYVSNGQRWGRAIGGAVGEAIADIYSPSHSIRAKLEEDHVDIRAILIEEMRIALAKQQRFRVVDSNADGVLSFVVKEYGFETASAFSGKMEVLLDVKVKLTDVRGQEVFHDSDSASNEDDTKHSMDDYFADLRLLHAAFHEVAAVVATGFVESLTDSADDGKPVAPAPVASTSTTTRKPD